MGWKASCTFASPRDDGYLKSFPAHEPQKARQLLTLLGSSYESRGMTTLEEGVYPRGGEHLYVGAYEQALVVGSMDFLDSAFEGGVPPIVDHARALLPDARVLIVTLHSVVDLFGYAWFEGGRLVRGRAGSADDGVFFEQGEPLPLERPLLADSVLRDGERAYPREIHGEEHEFDEAAFGEEFVMDVCRPFLGCRLDEYDLWDLQMEHFVRTGR